MTLFSFASAQAPLPSSILEELEDEIRQGPHRYSALCIPFSSREFEAIRAGAEQQLRDLLALTAEFRVLFLQGGATALFSLVPMNLLGEGDAADYVEAGLWSRRASKAAVAWGSIGVAADGDGRSLPRPDTWRRAAASVYCHITSNETAEGLQLHNFPDGRGSSLVADMTADFLTRPIAMDPFGLIYASAQKNFGVAGLTVVIIHESLLDRARRGVPAPFDFSLQAAERSKVNTPPTFAIAVAGKMFRWLDRSGGLSEAATRAAHRSTTLYSVIDSDAFYDCPASAEHRSHVSIRFVLQEQGLESAFLIDAEANGLLGLSGHPSVGGLRASLYNATTQDAVETLADFMNDFRRRKG